MFLIKSNPIETFFSAYFSFYEKDEEKELYEDIILGIQNMKMFLKVMKEEIKEECKLCDELEEKIDKMYFSQVPKNILFVDDYIYYGKQNIFERSSRGEVLFVESQNKPIKSNIESFYANLGIEDFKSQDLFKSLVAYHIFIFKHQKTIMPTFFIVYEDDSIEIKSFLFSVKTTVYRKINEIASRIEQDKIKSVFYVCEMLSYEGFDNKNIMNLSSKDRLEFESIESLCFFMIDNTLEIEHISIDTDKIEDKEYIKSASIKYSNDYLMKNSFLQPILDEFKRLAK